MKKKVTVLLFALLFAGLISLSGMKANAANVQEAISKNTMETATAIDCNTMIKGNISEKTETDYYKIQLEAAGCINIQFLHENLLDTKNYWSIKVSMSLS